MYDHKIHHPTAKIINIINLQLDDSYLWFCRDEGGLEYKSSIADTIITIIEENPEAKENGLSHLCEFIEDCEHTSLAVRILHLLGAEGPKVRVVFLTRDTVKL